MTSSFYLPMNIYKNWFIDLPRQKCKDILIAEFEKIGKSKGVFLVRRGHSNPKCPLVLMCYKFSFMDFHIEQHGKDAFYSLDEKNIFHGLDELIGYYRAKHDTAMLTINLSDYQSITSGSAPPVEYCLKGTRTDLHQAVIERNLEKVKSLLQNDPRKTLCKDDNGQTPLHLACIHNEDDSLDILRALLENGSNMITRDCFGNTAFIYACKNNKKKFVYYMVNLDHEIIQVKNSKNCNVALHVAALQGHYEIVKMLLDNDALTLQLNKEGKYPVDMALMNNHTNVIKLLTSYSPQIRTDHLDWEHGVINREDAEKLLKDEERALNKRKLLRQSDAIFLVRFSKTTKTFVLSIRCDGNFENFEIRKEQYFFYINQDQRMLSIDHLISHYIKFSDGLPARLRFPVEPAYVVALKNEEDENSSHECIVVNKSYDRVNFDKDENSDYYYPFTFTENSEKVYASCDILNFVNNKKKYPEYEDINELRELNNNFFFDESDIEISKDVLGEGNFGSVVRGYITKEDKTVAIKTLVEREFDEFDDLQKQKNKRDKNFCNFIREAAIMMNFDDPNIVQMIGIIRGPPMRIVQEFMSLGSLSHFIGNKSNLITTKDINIWANQIARGMKYLEKKKFVHRDLAARNILLTSKDHAKISDFGLSRTISVENKNFLMHSEEVLPIRWYAPECWHGRYSHASDVWSFAVTLWEIYTRGQIPFEHIKPKDLLTALKGGLILEQPLMCPDIIYNKMKECWDLDTNQRPKFEDIVKFYSDDNTYMNF